MRLANLLKELFWFISIQQRRINMNQKMANELEKRAKSMQLSTSNYCKILLQQWLDSGRKMKLEEQ